MAKRDIQTAEKAMRAKNNSQKLKTSQYDHDIDNQYGKGTEKSCAKIVAYLTSDQKVTNKMNKQYINCQFWKRRVGYPGEVITL